MQIRRRFAAIMRANIVFEAQKLRVKQRRHVLKSMVVDDILDFAGESPKRKIGRCHEAKWSSRSDGKL